MNNYNPISSFQTFMFHYEDEHKEWDNFEDNEFSSQKNFPDMINQLDSENQNVESDLVQTIENLIEEISPEKALNKFIDLMEDALNTTSSKEVKNNFKTDANTIDNTLENNKKYLNTKLV